MTTGSMLTRQQVADELSVSISTVGNLIRSRAIYALQVGSTYRIPREVLDAYKRGEPCPYGTSTGPETDPDVTTWPPTPSLLAALDGRDPDPQATDDRRAALDAATSSGIGCFPPADDAAGADS